MKGRRGIVIGAIVLVLAVLVLTGNLPPGASSGDGGGGGGGDSAPGEGRTFEGDGATETEPFTLQGGDYVFSWWAEGDRACQFDSRLRSTTSVRGGQQAGKIFNVTGARAERVTRVNRVRPGEYYIQVTGRCRWSITITPNATQT